MFKSRSASLRCLLLSSLGVLGLVGASAQIKTNVSALRLLEQQYARDAFVAKIAAEQRATALGMPIKGYLPNGAYFEAVDVENGRPVYNITDNVRAADSVSADEVQPGGSLGLSLTGSGVMLLEWDGGSARTTHQEFGGRVTSVDGAGISSHSTHVAGTMVGAGVNANARGMSYQASLRSFDWNSNTSEMASEAASGYQVSNHSYGNVTGWYHDGSDWYWYGNVSHSNSEDSNFGYYNSTARSWDNVCYNAPYFLPVKSAGNDRGDGPNTQPAGYYWDGNSWEPNTISRPKDGGTDGYDTVSTYGNAKNILTVGAVNDVIGGYNGPGSVGMSSFSGFGPADDGRIKPDIVGNGVSLTSATSSSNTSYGSSSGTSMSSPNVSGSLGLLIQHYSDTHAGAKMRAATIKGLALHTADECGSFDGPDYRFGWGLLNVKTAAQVISDDVALTDAISEEVLSDGGTFTHSVYSDGTGPLRVTISWTDPRGTVPSSGLDPATAVLVNDLDLRVTNGTTHFPWRLDRNNPANAATTGDNSVDNVEQVLIKTPTAGYYDITVSHKGSLQDGQQAFSMIVTGHKDNPTLVSGLSINPASITGGGTAIGTVTLSGPAPHGGVEVDLSSANPSVASVPASVTVLEGDTSADFDVDGAYVLSTASATITATLSDSVRKAVVEVSPRAPRLAGLVALPQAFLWSSGSLGTVTLDYPSPSGGTVVTLACSSARGWVPTSVTVPEGETSAAFPIASALTDPLQSWNFKVYAFLSGERLDYSMTILPQHFTMLDFRWNPVPMGHQAIIVIRTRTPAPGSGRSIDLSSSNPTLVPVPSKVTIPAGSTYVVVYVRTVPQPSAENVLITARYMGDSISNTIHVYP